MRLAPVRQRGAWRGIAKRRASFYVRPVAVGARSGCAAMPPWPILYCGEQTPVDSYEWNKIAGWVLAALVAVLGLSIGTGYLFPVRELDQQAYVVEGVEEAAGAVAGADAEPPISAFLASADLARGENEFRKCSACHSIERGGANGIGPNLWGIMGARHAQVSGFSYSPAMAATADQVWDWEGMSEWIRAPRNYIPGNRMSFAGIGRAQDRANLLAWMNTQGDRPLPIPAPPAAEEPAADDDAAATDGATEQEQAAAV
jgi:cytochrome c